MQIRLVIGEGDNRYLNNLIRFLEKNYMDKLEIFSFSTPDMLRNYLKSGLADVILIDENFGIGVDEIEGYGKAAYLCDNILETGRDGARTIAKYKKPDLIYKDILDIYAEKGKRAVFGDGSAHLGNLILVTGCSGGTGASTFAAALAKQYATRNKKTLYLNLEPMGSAADFFTGNGTYCFEDVIFALKSQRTDILLKMESTVRTDRSGVDFFEPCSMSMYMLELTHEDIIKTMEALKRSKNYDYVVIDMNLKVSGEFMEIMNCMNRIILVQDGSETSNSKFLRTMEALQILENQMDINIMSIMSVVYNRFSSSKSSSEITNLQLPVLGKIPPIKHALVNEIIDYIGKELPNIFETL